MEALMALLHACTSNPSTRTILRRRKCSSDAPRALQHVAEFSLGPCRRCLLRPRGPKGLPCHLHAELPNRNGMQN